MPTSLIYHWDPDKPCWDTLKQFFLQLPAGERIDKPYSPPRYLDQLALYWVLLNWVEFQTGNDRKQLHTLMKMQFLNGPRKRLKINGKIRIVREYGSTKKLNKKQFSEFYSKVELFFLENGVPPLPPHDSVEFQSLLDSAPDYY